MNRFQVERHYRVYDNINGYYYGLKPDPDGLGLIELVYCEDSVEKRVATFCKEEALLIAATLTKIANEIPDSKE